MWYVYILSSKKDGKLYVGSMRPCKYSWTIMASERAFVRISNASSRSWGVLLLGFAMALIHIGVAVQPLSSGAYSFESRLVSC
jgi:hypothetical protein